MEKEKLKEYMSIVVDMEKSIYLMERTKDELGRKIPNLGYAKEIRQPEKRWVPPVKSDGIGDVLSIIGTSFAIGFVVFIFNHKIADTVFWVLIAIGVVSLLFETWKKTKDYTKKIAESEKEHQMAMEEYQQKCDEEKRRLEKENIEKECLLAMMCDVDLQLYSSTCNLKKIYEENVIFPKYRNLAMMCYLYEYISSGRCDRLEGPDGGYNMLETDMRFDRISLQMDTVISQLNDIKANQSMIYSAMRDIQYQQAELISDATSRIMSGIKTVGDHISDSNEVLRELRDSSALTAYYSERIQKELSYMNRMDFLTGRNDDAFFNIPPT